VCVCVCVCVCVNMLMKIRLHNVSEFITSKCAPPTFLQRSYSTVVSPVKDEEYFICLFIYYWFI